MQSHILKFTVLLAGMAALPALAMTTIDNASRSSAAKPAATAMPSRAASAPTSREQSAPRSTHESTRTTKPRY